MMQYRKLDPYFLFICLLLGGNILHAQVSQDLTTPEVSNTADPAPAVTQTVLMTTINVDWHKPTVGFSTDPKRSQVILSGQTQPGAKLRLSGDEIPMVSKSGQVQFIKRDTVMKEKFVRADERGVFEFQLNLPYATAQLPIEVKSTSGITKQYQINMAVRKEDVSLTNVENIKNSPYARRKWGVWIGAGFNYLKYDQETNDIPSQLGFESFALPSIYGKVVRNLTEEWAFQATYNSSPGKTSSSDAVQVSQGNYAWSYLTGEFTFFHPKWKLLHEKYYSKFGTQVGLQYHMVPFVKRSSTSDPTIASIETNEVLMIALGGTWNIHYGRYLLFEIFMRYQSPYYYGDLFDIETEFAFDGSLGAIYKWKPDWRVGLFWYGQWHKYRFTNHRDVYFEANGGGGPDISGKQEIFYSNIEARIGFEFD